MCELSGDVVVLGQHEGGDVQLRVYGDEFYARYETLDGYTVVYDTLVGRYCYAVLSGGSSGRSSGGRLTSSGVKIDKPAPGGVSRHIQEDPSVRNRTFDRRYERLRPPETDLGLNAERTFGPDDGLLDGRKLHEGTVVGLTLLVDFDDVRMNITADQVTAMMNEPGYRDHGNNGSVRDFFLAVSAGKLDYPNVVIGPVRLSKRRSFYINNSMVEEAVDLAVTRHGIDLSQFDSRDEGIVDAVNILYAGTSQYVGDLWPHNSVRQVTHGGVRTHFYQLTGVGTHPVDLRIGTICHENGHLLCRFPDLYDYGRRDGDNTKSAGIGRYCLMGSGNHLDHRRSPAAVSAYLRNLAGWTDDIVLLNDTGTYEARHGAYDQVMKYQLPSPNEYFLVENRTRMGLDSHLPASGLAVYHCDTRGSNEWQDGTRERHYQLALLQADGRLDLENDVNSGDPGDLFAGIGGVAVSHDTVPDTRRWDGSDSGLTISDVSAPGEVMTFTVGPPVTDDRTVVGQSFPDLAIPDDDEGGVVDVIDVDTSGSVVSVALGVNIIHPWIGDITIDLVGPDGTRVRVREREGRGDDDLHLDLDADDLPALAGLAGRPAGGRWHLEVVDHARRDVGRLVDWAIEVGVTDAGTTVGGRNDNPVAIPDDAPAGVSSTIELTGTGAARVLVVEVAIEHTYIGDLQIDLVSPGGVSVRLHDRDGRGTDNLARRWDSRVDGVLATMVDAEVTGEWRLDIRDLARSDDGRLVSWSITATV